MGESRLESLFSAEVVQPYHEMPYEGYKKSHDDRLFKHVTFSTSDSGIMAAASANPALRIKTMDHNWSSIQESYTKTHDLGIAEADWNEEMDKVRVKSVLSTTVKGVKDSYWNTMSHYDYGLAQDMNQYRVKGVANTGIRSNWVYSELRDLDNELVIFELLHDILDIAMYAKDSNVEFLVNHLVSDSVKWLFLNQMPADKAIEYGHVNELTDSTVVQSLEDILLSKDLNKVLGGHQVSRIQEISDLLSNRISKGFKEKITGSPEELFHFAKAYKVLDRFITKNDDFLALLVEAYLEEEFENIVQEINYEVLLKNDEEMHLLLQSVYDFDIKSELIRHAYEIELDDRFVTALNDTVKLITEPVFYEKLMYGTDESFHQFMRMTIHELYVPFLIMEQRGIEMLSDLYDEKRDAPESNVASYEMTSGGLSTKYMLLEEAFKLMAEGFVEKDYHVEFIENIINMVHYKGINLYIEYDPVEFIEYTTSIQENFKTQYQKMMSQHAEKQGVFMNETMHHAFGTSYKTASESYQAKIEDLYHIQSLLNKRKVVEASAIRATDDADLKEATGHNLTEEAATLATTDHTEMKSGKSKSLATETSTVMPIDSTKTEDAKSKENVAEDRVIGTTDAAALARTKSKSEIEESTFIRNEEHMLHEDTSDYFKNKFTQHIALYGFLFYEDTKKKFRRSESKRLLLDSRYHQMYIERPSDLIHPIFSDTVIFETNGDPWDSFFENIYLKMDDSDVVVYLGDLGGDWPLSEFTVGINTLQGDPDNEHSYTEGEDTTNNW